MSAPQSVVARAPLPVKHDSLVLAANQRRNQQAAWWRTPRWRHARAQLWRLLDRHVDAGARVAVVGTGNGQDLPLRQLAGRAGELWLFDLDSEAIGRARHRARHGGRVIMHALDVTGGAADAIISAAIDQHEPSAPLPVDPLPGGPFDVVIADLLYTQLLYPGLADSDLPAAAIDECLTRHGQPLTDRVVNALHESAPHGLVVHLHDLLGWWTGRAQPITPAQLVALAGNDPRVALTLAAKANPPLGCDPRSALMSLAAEIIETSTWLWPFAPGVDYLVCATVAGTQTGAHH